MYCIVRAVLANLLVLLATVGCASDRGAATEPVRPLRLENITLAMVQGANNNSPARVDLIRVEDVTLIKQLLSIETTAWFAEKRDAFRNAHPEAIFNIWEPVPGVVSGPFEVGLDIDVAGVLFCGVKIASAPLRFERDGNVIVRIDDTGCVISGGEPSDEPGWFDNSNFWPWSD